VRALCGSVCLRGPHARVPLARIACPRNSVRVAPGIRSELEVACDRASKSRDHRTKFQRQANSRRSPIQRHGRGPSRAGAAQSAGCFRAELGAWAEAAGSGMHADARWISVKSASPRGVGATRCFGGSRRGECGSVEDDSV